MKLITNFIIADVALVPWSATEVGNTRSKTGRKFRFVKKNPRLVTFQEHISRLAKSSMGLELAHDGPCYLDLWMIKRTPMNDLWGTWCYVPLGGQRNLRGDLTNLIKSIEDGLEGVVFTSDQLVCAGRQSIIWGKTDTVIVKVYALLPEDMTSVHPQPLI